MIASIVAMDQKERESEEIARKTEEYLAGGREVTTVDFGVGQNSMGAYRDYQSKLAKMNASNKAAKEANLIPLGISRER